MSFDPITLAMAKAYTDEKTSGVGSGGAVLPVVELETVLNAEGNEVTLSAKDNATLDTIGDTPCIIKFPFEIDGAANTVSVFFSTGYREGNMLWHSTTLALGAVAVPIMFINYFDGTGWSCAAGSV